MRKQVLKTVPSTTLGKWSVALIVVMPILTIVGTSLADSLYAGVPAGDTIGADLMARPALALTMLVAVPCGIAAFVTGLLAILRQKEYALMVLISTAAGGLLLIFLAGELAFPH